MMSFWLDDQNEGIRNRQPELPTSWGDKHKLKPDDTASGVISTTNAISVNRELWERCVGLVRRVSDERVECGRPNPGAWFGLSTEIGDEAREIAKLLPVVEDADLIEARSVAASIGKARGYTANWREECLNGEQDNNEYVIGAVAGIRRGRELERGSEK